MVIKNSADAITYACTVIEQLVGRENINYDELHDMIVATMYLERYLTLMEIEKEHGDLYGVAGCFKSTTTYEKCFNMCKRNAECELGIIDRILNKDIDAAE